jgi:hypothetical protein
MKNKSTLILGGVFLLLVVIFLFTSLHPKEVTRGATPLFKGQTPVIDKLELLNPRGDNIVLEKQNEVWSITKPVAYKASPEVITQVLEGFNGVMIDGVVTSDPNEKSRFGVEDSTAVRLKVTGGGKTVLDILIGRYAPDLSHTYVRKYGKNDIELWRGIFARTVNREIDEWRDKSIFSFNEGDITSVKASDGKNTRQLTLSDSTWTYAENGKQKPVDQAKVKEYVSLIATLKCDAFAAEEDIPRAASNKPDTQVSFTVRNGDTHTFDLWTPKKDSDNKRTLLRKTGGDILFQFYENRGEQLPMNYEKMKPVS